MTQAALRMKEAKESNDKDAMLTAVRLNWRLWTIIQADLLGSDSPVHSDLRSNALSLANFIDRHTLDFISDPTPEKMDILIYINRELAGGLREKPEETAQDLNDDQGSGEDSKAEPSATDTTDTKV